MRCLRFVAVACGVGLVVASVASCRNKTPKYGDLTALADSWGTDKGTRGHRFTEVYERFFHPIRLEAKKVLEIGVLRGASLRMWQDYLPQARIFGLDIVDTSEFNSDRIKTFIADQSNRQQLQAFLDVAGSDFDFIIDDGGHSMEQQQVSFGYLFRHVKPGGFYVIEDVHTSLYGLYGDRYGATQSGEGTTLAMIDHFIRSGTIESRHMTAEEKDSFSNEIIYVNLLRQENSQSIACIFRKRGPMDERGKRAKNPTD